MIKDEFDLFFRHFISYEQASSHTHRLRTHSPRLKAQAIELECRGSRTRSTYLLVEGASDVLHIPLVSPIALDDFDRACLDPGRRGLHDPVGTGL
ncbi:hypothetical protein BCAR13_240016 [Paraburkholderia caribensis]|nr:hypothetical protein BCAR13_240016 [Paraburkholderia caribensis]